jgi:CubicO group peptidase (beta-lactamase class C family)
LPFESEEALEYPLNVDLALQRLSELDPAIDSMLRAARIPGGGVAVVLGGEIVFCRGYGLRDVSEGLPSTAETVFPIASMSKAMTATMIGTLVDEGTLNWDKPVQSYWPKFRLGDSNVSAQVTLRDLLTLRTGLPRHDWAWVENPSSREELVERIRYLPLSCGFRERFQYNNLTVIAAGFIAEVVSGMQWETLIEERLLEPLGMTATLFVNPALGNATRSYCEDRDRRLKPTQRLSVEVSGPSGGSIHSNILDMARWVLLNLNDGQIGGRRLIKPETLREIQRPQVSAGIEPAAPAPHASYAMGWFVHYYNGYEMWSHGGYMHDVNSEVMLCPKEKWGIVSYTNFGFPTLARLLNQHTFDILTGLRHVRTLEEKLAAYENGVIAIRQRDVISPRVENTSPSHSLDAHEGSYFNSGYGTIEILREGNDLVLRRNHMLLSLEHWHYDVWVCKDPGIFYIHVPHAFDRTSKIMFETGEDGDIRHLRVRLEPAVEPIRFAKQ